MAPITHGVASALAPLRARLPETALLFDLDGTIAPIRPLPDQVALSPAMKDGLAALVDRAGLVAFVSGRALADLEGIVALSGCAYVGNHGMEIRRPDGARDVAESARPWLTTIERFANAVDAERLEQAGAWMEDKGVTLSFHYRTAPDQSVARAYLEAEIVPVAEAEGLRVTHGRKVVEVRPPVEVNKGTAVRQLVTTSPCALATYLGDDVTDVDAWVALRSLAEAGALQAAVSVAVVGHETSGAVSREADVTIHGVEGALDLVCWLAGGSDHPDAGVS
jgi:trehalose 6-phosphate phosphatase